MRKRVLQRRCQENYILVGVADVERVFETAELGEDAASEPVIVLDEAAQTAVEDIPALKRFRSTEVKAIEDAEEPECAAQAATEELCDEDAIEPMTEKAEAKVPREATQTAVNKIMALNFQFKEVAAEYAEEHEDTPED
jgi:hypothetical protein